MKWDKTRRKSSKNWTKKKIQKITFCFILSWSVQMLKSFFFWSILFCSYFHVTVWPTDAHVCAHNNRTNRKENERNTEIKKTKYCRNERNNRYINDYYLRTYIIALCDQCRIGVHQTMIVVGTHKCCACGQWYRRNEPNKKHPNIFLRIFFLLGRGFSFRNQMFDFSIWRINTVYVYLAAEISSFPFGLVSNSTKIIRKNSKQRRWRKRKTQDENMSGGEISGQQKIKQKEKEKNIFQTIKRKCKRIREE